MQTKPGILIVGSAAIAERARRAVERAPVVAVDTLLSGVWELGRQRHAAVLLVLAPGTTTGRAIAAMRQLSPRSRIVVACEPIDEPRARQSLTAGADEYLLQPVTDADLRNLAAHQPTQPADGNGTTAVTELVHLGDVLGGLGEGPQATLNRFALLVQRTLGASGVAIELDDLRAHAGDISQPTLCEAIQRGGAAVGRLSLGPPVGHTYSATAAARVADICRMVDAAVGEARERERLRELAWTDDLTGLRNRRYFDQTLDALLIEAREARSRVTLLLFDIDDFKGYNDHYGHETGDALLQEVAMLLNRCSRADDVVARYGGDEFGVIFWDAEAPRVPGSTHPTEPVALAERFCQAISRHQFACLGPQAPGPVTLSGGLACFPWHGNSRTELMRAADAALLAAKRGGKNHLILAGSGFSGAQEDRVPQ